MVLEVEEWRNLAFLMLPIDKPLVHYDVHPLVFGVEIIPLTSLSKASQSELQTDVLQRLGQAYGEREEVAWIQFLA